MAHFAAESVAHFAAVHLAHFTRNIHNKTNSIDARKMARHHAAGILEGVHVPTEKSQKQRSIIRFKKKLSGNLVGAKNRLKSKLKFQGIEVPQKYDNPH